MSETQFALATLALLRISAAVALFDLFRRLRQPSIALLSLGMTIFAADPALNLLLGGSDYSMRSSVLQAVAVTLILTGAMGHFTRVPVRIALLVSALAGAAAFLGALVLPPSTQASDALFLVVLVFVTGVVIWKRKPFKKAAGTSYEWGLLILGVAFVLYLLRLLATHTAFELVADQILHVTISVALGLYLMNLEFNASYIALQRSEGRYRTVVNSAGDAILISAPSGKILDANTVATDMLGYTIDELRNMRLADVDDETSAARIAQHVDQIHRDGRAVFESTWVRKDGTQLPVEVSAVPFEWGGVPALLGIIRDLTERKRSEELILQMAYYDPLTGLANRTLFNDRLALAVAHARRTGDGLGLIFLDVDHFKVVNDTLGHPMGDKLLAAIGERLAGLVREGDTVARLGGDEYTLLLPQVATEESAGVIAWKVLEALRAPYMLDEIHQIHATASLGIALTSGADETPDELVRNADIAMFRAKDRGRNTFQFYDPAMNAIATEHFELKNELRRALADGQLELHYQPQVSVSDGRIVGAEALLRWHNPTRGDVPPSVFIPLAEESGMIIEIGRWVLAEACRTAKQWHDAGYERIRIAVNLSARQLLDDDLYAYICEMLTDCNVSTSCLELEITESIAMQHSGAVIEAFRRLGDMGIRFAIDDFGTGYSSLDRLKQLPIHTLKVAQPFVEDLGEGEDAEAIVAAIVSLGQSLGLNIIAEGVETATQLERLRARACSEMQGFWFSPAVPADKFLDLLAEQREKFPAESA